MKKSIISLSLFFFLLSFIGCEKQEIIDEDNAQSSIKDSIETISTSRVLVAGFAKGADVSWVSEMEASGIKFYNSLGKEQDLFAILKSKGMNAIRLRVWINPYNGWNNLEDVLAKAKRAKAAKMKIMIDFHYSDTWADPSQQITPTAWSTHDIFALCVDVWTYTKEVLEVLRTNNIYPKWVQVGNETNDGMLWEEGRASKSMRNFAWLINSGNDAVKLVFPKAKVIVHVSNGYDNGLYRWLFDGLTEHNARYDVIGMSLYPNYNNWQELNNQCLANMNDMVSRYGKKVMICEVGMPIDDPATCKLFLSDIINKTNSLTAGNGLGVFYWEPEAYAGWQGWGAGAWENNGRPTEALDAFLLR